MKRLGIGETSGFIYESTENYPWGPLWPAPVVMEAAFIEVQGAPPCPLGTTRPSILFREDAFDPVSRIRRGRFYDQSRAEQPSWCNTLPHEVYGLWGQAVASANNHGGHRLFTFDALTLLPCAAPYTTHHVLLGAADSRWRIIAAEKISTSELLVTLKARGTLGALPELNPNAIHAKGRERAEEVYSKLVDSAHRESPVSVVDRARDAAQWLLGVWLAESGGDWSLPNIDLGKLIPKVKEQDKLISSAAQIVARLHSKKPNEQYRRGLLPPTENDADCALACVGLLIREFGWVA